MSIKPVEILLVEDNEVDVEAVRRAFKIHKIANPITRATDGLDALSILRGETDHGQMKRPYLILLDLNMPRMNGIEFLQEIRSDPDLHDIIVFVLTTSKSDEDLVASYELNVAGYMVKENVGKDFTQLVNMMDMYWKVVEFPPDRS